MDPKASDASPERVLSVLVADDEPMIVRALERLLARRGHDVYTAPDAYRALELLDERSYDAVLVDDNMPGGGKSVLSRLDDESFPGIAVLMTGGLAADATDVSDGVRRLQKPFPFRSVIPLIEGLTPQ